jgi:hypothetical protein
MMGKDQQLQVGSPDFQGLMRTGLHDEEQLRSKEMITGIPIDVINCTAKPNGFSYSGFLAGDENIISVLIGDNQIVRAMGLIHPELAKPLFHVWNLILLEKELGNWTRFYDHIRQIHYNGHVLNFESSGSKGWQQSIFFDEIQGRYNIHIDRKLTMDEVLFLHHNYPELSDAEFEILEKKLTVLDFSEMLPYYITRYGFYEGHTDYRCDPVAIALIFGLKTIEQIEDACQHELFKMLTRHYTIKN